MPSVVAGLTTTLDMTAKDILRKNPRYLTRAKSFGPQLVTPDEVGEIENLTVATVSFHSKGMTLLPQEPYELTTPRRSASPPHWVRSRRSSWGWSSG